MKKGRSFGKLGQTKMAIERYYRLHPNSKPTKPSTRAVKEKLLLKKKQKKR